MADFHNTASLHSSIPRRSEKLPADEDLHYRAVLDGLPAAVYTTDAFGASPISTKPP